MQLVESLSVWTVAACLVACGSPEDRPSYLWIDTGHEADTWTADPEAVTIEISELRLDGTAAHFTTLPPPDDGKPFSVPLDGATGGWFLVEGLDANGIVQVRGYSTLYTPDANLGLPVRVFAGRVRHFNRPTSGFFESQGQSPPTAVLGTRWLVSAGARYTTDTAARLDTYDLVGMTAAAPILIPCPSVGCKTRSLVTLPNGFVALIGDDWGVWADFACGTDCTGTLAMPDDLEAFSDVAGGRTVLGAGGTRTIVGATRLDEPTQTILHFDPDGWVVARLHDTPRSRAAAAWTNGRGLLIAGGSAEGSGAELWDGESQSFESLPYPSDPTQGADLVPLDARYVLRVGGRVSETEFAPSVVYDLDCVADCVPIPVDAPVELANVTAYHQEGTILAIGTNADGWTEGRLITSDAIETIELREQRAGASVLKTTRGEIVVAGGELTDGAPALTLEFYQP